MMYKLAQENIIRAIEIFKIVHAKKINTNVLKKDDI